MMDFLFIFMLAWTALSLMLRLVYHDYDENGGSRTFDGIVWSTIIAYLMTLIF